MELFTLASGSSGNCTVVRSSRGTFLIDAGISWRRIATGLRERGLLPTRLDGVLITHEHSDHIQGLKMLLKYNPIPVYTAPLTGAWLKEKLPLLDAYLRPVKAGQSFSVGGVEVFPFRTPHDGVESLGFTFTDGHSRGALATDLGYVSEEVAAAIHGADLVLLETNYEPDWLLHGPYPPCLQQRILGRRGHLSNYEGAELACRLVQAGTKTLILGHLSDKNNTPEQAYAVVSATLHSAGIQPGAHVRLEVAPRALPGPVYQF